MRTGLRAFEGEQGPVRAGRDHEGCAERDRMVGMASLEIHKAFMIKKQEWRHQEPLHPVMHSTPTYEHLLCSQRRPRWVREVTDQEERLSTRRTIWSWQPVGAGVQGPVRRWDHRGGRTWTLPWEAVTVSWRSWAIRNGRTSLDRKRQEGPSGRDLWVREKSWPRLHAVQSRVQINGLQTFCSEPPLKKWCTSSTY